MHECFNSLSGSGTLWYVSCGSSEHCDTTWNLPHILGKWKRILSDKFCGWQMVPTLKQPLLEELQGDCKPPWGEGLMPKMKLDIVLFFHYNCEMAFHKQPSKYYCFSWCFFKVVSLLSFNTEKILNIGLTGHVWQPVKASGAGTWEGAWCHVCCYITSGENPGIT